MEAQEDAVNPILPAPSDAKFYFQLLGVNMSNMPNLFLAESQMLSTNMLAERLGMKAQSIRKRYAQTGAYFGLKPIKLPNGRLYWPSNAIDQLLTGMDK